MLIGRPSAWFLLVALLAFAPKAWAGVPVQLPASEAPEDWAPYLAVADFEVGTPGAGPYVRFEPEGDGWRVRVQGTDGAERTRLVAAPTNARDREALISVAHSLLNPPRWTEPSWDDLATALPGGGDVFEAPLELPPLTPAPAPARAPVTPVRPSPTLEPAPVTAMDPEPVVEPQPEPVVEPQPKPPEKEIEKEILPAPARKPLLARAAELRTPVGVEPPKLHGWARAGMAYAGRQGVAGGVLFDVAGGMSLDQALRIGLEIAGMTPGRISGVPGKRTSSDADVGAVVELVQPRIGLVFAVQIGVGFRMFESEGAVFATKTTFQFGPMLGWDVRLPGAPLRIQPFGGVRIDTLPIDIVIQDSDVPVVRRGVVAWKGGVRVLWAPGHTKARRSVIQNDGS